MEDPSQATHQSSPRAWGQQEIVHAMVENREKGTPKKIKTSNILHHPTKTVNSDNYYCSNLFDLYLLEHTRTNAMFGHTQSCFKGYTVYSIYRHPVGPSGRCFWPIRHQLGSSSPYSWWPNLQTKVINEARRNWTSLWFTQASTWCTCWAVLNPISIHIPVLVGKVLNRITRVFLQIPHLKYWPISKWHWLNIIVPRWIIAKYINLSATTMVYHHFPHQSCTVLPFNIIQPWKSLKCA